MTLEEFMSQVARSLARPQVPYMLTGSVASSAHGAPRSTRDLDIVIAPTSEQLLALIEEFPSPVYYADREQALQALANGSQFNVIHMASGWKVDFIIAEDSEYGRTALARSRQIDLAGQAVQVASPEDVLIAKLRWAKLGSSDRQLQDAAGIVTTQGSKLDYEYVERWVRELQIVEQWQEARQRARRG